MKGHHTSLYIFLVMAISIGAMAIAWAYLTITRDAFGAFWVALGCYIVSYLAIGIVKRATGREAFKNARRSFFMMLLKALFFAIGVVMLVGPILAGNDSLFETISGRLKMDVLTAISCAAIYMGLSVAMAVFTNVTIKGE